MSRSIRTAVNLSLALAACGLPHAVTPLDARDAAGADRGTDSPASPDVATAPDSDPSDDGALALEDTRDVQAAPDSSETVDAAPDAIDVSGPETTETSVADAGGGDARDAPEDAAPEAAADATPDACGYMHFTGYSDRPAQTWSDCSPSGTYTRSEAMTACMTQGAHPCLDISCANDGSIDRYVCTAAPPATGLCWLYSSPIAAPGWTGAIEEICHTQSPWRWY